MNVSRRAMLALPLALAACKYRKEILRFSGPTMGTTYNVVVVDHDGRLDEGEVKSAIDGALVHVNASLSNWDATSEISRFNATRTQAPVQLSAVLASVMAASDLVHQASQGRFDTTIGPLIEAWGFGSTGAPAMPNATTLDTALERSGHGNTLLLNGGKMTKRRGDAQIYLAGVGKGYGADHVGQALMNLGANDYLVEIGGDLVTAGRNLDGLPWQIGIETPNPADRSVFDVVGLKGRGLATSGDYRNYFEIDGQRYSHLIDPALGRPVAHNTASATVIADDAMMADAWSTAMLILGREHGLEIAAAHGVAVQFIERDRDAQTLAFTTHTSDTFNELTA
ncbi:MAG: FAD:protein FMN transferase [Rhodobacteraceae bacterium]|nr:FAD:protein FMN transferase [Paracoccaceae bacterium]